MEDVSIPAQTILMFYVFHCYGKLLIKEDFQGKEGSSSAVIQKELLPNTRSSREENRKMTENVLTRR